MKDFIITFSFVGLVLLSFRVFTDHQHLEQLAKYCKTLEYRIDILTERSR